MVWTLQLTPWALPPLLAVLLVVRETLFLWPRRREQASQSLLLLAGASGAWAVCHLLAVLSPSLEVKVVMERIQYVAAAAVPVGWAAFALTYADRRNELYRAPMVGLYAVSAGTAFLALHPSGFSEIARNMALAVHPSGFQGMTVTYGPWFWAQVAVRLMAIIVSSFVLGRALARRPGRWKRLPVLLAAVTVAVGPSVAHLAVRSGAQWVDLTPTAFGMASAILGWGLLRHRLLDLGPVARTLVMVELRDPIVVLDARGRIVDVNRAAERILGLQPYGDVPLALGTMWASSRGRHERYATITLPVAGGGPEEERTFEVTITPLGRSEAVGRTALVFRDVTQRERMEHDLRKTTEALQQANEELQRRANTDGLTGLANRRHFMEELARELERAERYQRPLSVLLLDMDHFKKVNDTYGHQAGDDVLRAAAEALRSICRDVDLPARLGGEELSVLLPETDVAGATRVAERLRERIERVRHEAPDGGTFQVTASIGVSSVANDMFTDTDLTPDALLHRADQALYEAKQGGRNRVAAAAGPLPPEPAETPSAPEG